jgi:hypothetical protein
MADLLELSEQYRDSGIACRNALKLMKRRLEEDCLLRPEDIIELRRRITVVTAMSRECIEISEYLKKYHGRRARLEAYRQKNRI